MAHLENKLEDYFKKAKGESKKHRGLKEVETDMEKVHKHISKASHNLKAMLYFIKGNFPDWAISASFYARYHCLLAILAKCGYKSRNQECTYSQEKRKSKMAKLNFQPFHLAGDKFCSFLYKFLTM